jgi:DNA (cytosine-5)-methyltransferase 1
MLRALDLFCCAGGATRGLQLAGFHVTGVDHEPQPRYCGDAFHQADALTFPLHGYDLIWASPPCQAYTPASWTARQQGHTYPTLIGATRRCLQDSGTAWVIENVPSAPLRQGAILLCGLSFGLPLLRHRRFESSFTMLAPSHTRHTRGSAIRGETFTVFGKAGSLTNRRRGKSQPYSTARVQEARVALGIDWMLYSEMAESVPPAYAEFIAREFLKGAAKQPAALA